MKFVVLKNDVQLGELVFVNGVHHFKGDAACATFIADSVRGKIKILSDEWFDGDSVVTERPINQSSHLFQFALMDHLRDHGFVLEPLHESIENQFAALLARFDGDVARQTQLRERWTIMSLLEKTYLLELVEQDRMSKK